MGVSTKAGTFLTGAGIVGSTVPVTGLGFQPKVIFFAWTGGGVLPQNTGGNARPGMGVAVSPSKRFSVTNYVADAVGTTDTLSSHRADGCYEVIGGTNFGRLDLQSMDVDGFTLEVDLTPSGSLYVPYWALGGSDITNVETGVFQEPGSTGNVAVTGLGFQPTVVFLFSTGDTTAAPNQKNDAEMAIGAFTASAQYVFSMKALDNQATPNRQNTYCLPGEVMAFVDAATSPAAVTRAQAVSLDSDGFTINFVERSSTRYIHWVAIRGGRWQLGDFLTSTAPATVRTESGFGFQPRGALVVTAHGPADTADTVTKETLELNVGAFSSVSDRWVCAIDQVDGADPTNVHRGMRDDTIVMDMDSIGGIDARLDIDSITSDGFTVIQDADESGTNRFVWYAAVGDGVSAVRHRVRTYAYG